LSCNEAHLRQRFFVPLVVRIFFPHLCPSYPGHLIIFICTTYKEFYAKENMANKPSYSQARKRRGTATMTIEPAPKTFTDKNLDPQLSPGGAEKVSKDNAAPGGSISPELNAPKQTSHGTGLNKPDAEGLTKT
jgi:hypothetical protein